MTAMRNWIITMSWARKGYVTGLMGCSIAEVRGEVRVVRDEQGDDDDCVDQGCKRMKGNFSEDISQVQFTREVARSCGCRRCLHVAPSTAGAYLSSQPDTYNLALPSQDIISCVQRRAILPEHIEICEDIICIVIAQLGYVSSLDEHVLSQARRNDRLMQRSSHSSATSVLLDLHSQHSSSSNLTIGLSTTTRTLASLTSLNSPPPAFSHALPH